MRLWDMRSGHQLYPSSSAVFVCALHLIPTRKNSFFYECTFPLRRSSPSGVEWVNRAWQEFRSGVQLSPRDESDL